MFLVFLVNIAVVGVVVILHYEFLYRLTTHIPRMHMKHRFRIVLGVFTALVAHAAEVWVFALVYYVKHHATGWGHFQGNFNGSLLDCVYF